MLKVLILFKKKIVFIQLPVYSNSKKFMLLFFSDNLIQKSMYWVSYGSFALPTCQIKIKH